MKVCVVGAGASGLMAAYAAAANGNDVTVYEKNEKCGKKIYITGKGRCNLTNDCTPEEFLLNVVNNPKFMLSPINKLTPKETQELFESFGLRIKTERGGRVFPLSDKASDVTLALERACKNLGVKFIFNAEITDLLILESTIRGIISGKEEIFYDKVLVCTGGLSYPSTGSTGDGYKFASKLGHEITKPLPALCGLNLDGNYFSDMQGLTLKNVGLNIYYKNKQIKSLFGEMLFTHYGVSGPIILSASSLINRLDLKDVSLSIDLKPALSVEQLDSRILRDFSEFKNKSIENCLKNLLPKSIICEVLARAKILPTKAVNAITKPERAALISVIKSFSLKVKSLRDFSEAIITSGGIKVNKINPATMESKIIKGLYFCGEVLDVDAFTGGFNLQIAFSTGYAAGSSIKA